MQASHMRSLLSTTQPTPALEALLQFVEKHRTAEAPVDDFSAFEVELRSLVAAAEAQLVGEALARHDVDAPVILVNGVAHQRRLRSSKTYITLAGEVKVERWLYGTREDGVRCVSPMELGAGVVAGLFTPSAARLAAYAHAHLTPGESDRMFKEVGRMQPSRSTLDRVVKCLGERWERNRVEFEVKLDEALNVPDEAVTVALSLDGVMAPMRDGDRKGKRAASKRAGKKLGGPAGYQEVGCATLSFFDVGGERLSTVQIGRMSSRPGPVQEVHPQADDGAHRAARRRAAAGPYAGESS